MVALNGSPLGAGAAFGAVMAASLANGGSLDDIGPGISFFAELAKLGNFNPSAATSASLVSGQTPIVINWDYLNLAQAKKSKGMTPIDTVIPASATPYGAFYCQAISKFAPHPKAAQLWEEFLYSDEGQLLFLEGFAHPARFSDMAKRGVISKELMAALPPAEPYAAAAFAEQRPNQEGAEGARRGLDQDGQGVTPGGARASARPGLPMARWGARSGGVPSLLFVGPFLLYVTAFLILPAGMLLVEAFAGKNGPTLSYVAGLGAGPTLVAFRNSLVLSALSALVGLVAGGLGAYFVMRPGMPRGLARSSRASARWRRTSPACRSPSPSSPRWAASG